MTLSLSPFFNVRLNWTQTSPLPVQILRMLTRTWASLTSPRNMLARPMSFVTERLSERGSRSPLCITFSEVVSCERASKLRICGRNRIPTIPCLINIGRSPMSSVLFLMHLESRRVSLGGMTPYPDHQWMEQQARNATMEGWGFLRGCRYLLHDRDRKFCASFRELIESGSVETIRLPARSPNLNAFAERWVRSVKEECLSRLILFGESSPRRALQQYIVHYHEERNHQGKENLILFPTQTEARKKKDGAVRCRERLGGLLKYYEWEAA